MEKHSDVSHEGEQTGAHEHTVHGVATNNHMVTSIFGSLVSFINTLITRATTLKVAKDRLEADEREAALQRGHDLARDEADRQHQRELEEQRAHHANERDARALAAKSKEEWLRYVYQTQQAKGGLIIEPGLWKSQVFSTWQTGPFILFDKLGADLEGRAGLPFDPIQFLAEQFKLQSQDYGRFLKAVTIREGFNSDAHARQFLKREFAEDSVALVYATFSGNRLSFHTLYHGLTADQLLLIREEGQTIVVPDRTDYALLGRFPFSFFRDLTARRAPQAVTQRRGGSRRQRGAEDAEFLFDLIVNTSLQVLVDEYVACQMYLPFAPRALALFREKTAHLRALGLWDDALAEKLELHDRRLQSLRAHVKSLAE